MNPRYRNKNIAVLGAGLSGTAAALLLRSHDANVSVLDSATENKLAESTIKNLRDHGVHVISGPAAETNRDAYDLAVLSPGIDPDSPLAQSFSSRNIEMIGELELGWQFCELPLVAIKFSMLCEPRNLTSASRNTGVVSKQIVPSAKRKSARSS